VLRVLCGESFLQVQLYFFGATVKGLNRPTLFNTPMEAMLTSRLEPP
jgi:hypothetical protein